MKSSKWSNPFRSPERRGGDASPRTAGDRLRGAVGTTLAVLLALPVLGPPGALAAPQGAQVQHGSATFETQGSTTVIRTSTPVTIIDYQSFDIGQNEAVHIHQPSAAARVMNKVLPTDPTHIDGQLWSNGQVYILNAAGIFFGSDAVVDVGRLVAAAGSLSNADFIAGVDRFTDLAGAVGNDGVIEADSVALIGRTVANHGTIVAEDGMIALLAGDQVMLSKIEGRVVVRVDGAAEDPGEFAVEQTGTLDAGRGRVSLTAGDTWSLAINHSGITRGGDIHLEAGAGIVQVAGTLDAANRGATSGTGGRIEVTGEKVGLGDALLDASGDEGGGEIHVGGDVSGKGELANARRTYVSPDAVLAADADETGDGGEIVVWSDEWTVFRGAASARGGASGGDGGFVEISGHALEATGDVDLGAAAGRGGTLLYDPERIEIVGGDGEPPTDGTDAGTEPDLVRGDDGTIGIVTVDDEGVFDAEVPEGNFVIYESEIEGTSADVLLLEAEKSVTALGDFADGDVQLQDEVVLSIATTGSADEKTGAQDLRGVDLGGDDGQLVWKAGEGGAIVLATGPDSSEDAQITAHRLEAHGVPSGGGASIFVAAAGGDVVIDEINTSARVDQGGQGGEGGTVVVFTNGPDLDVHIKDSIVTTGGHAIAAADAASSDVPAGAGGDVVIQPSQVGAATGNVTVGLIDTSGGDASEAVPGSGGTAGAITLRAEGGDLVVAGPLVANGGLGVMQDPREDAVVQGGGGGAIDLSLAQVAGESGHVIRVEGDIEARGGNLRGIVADQGQLGRGGAGGRVDVTTDGVAQLGTPAGPIGIDLSGGDVDEFVLVDGVPVPSVGDGGAGGSLGATVGSDGRASGLLVNAAIDIRGGTARNGTGGSGGVMGLESLFGPIVGLSDAGTGFASALDLSGGDALGDETFEDPEGMRQFSAIAGGGGDVNVLARDGLTWGTIASRTGSAPDGTVAEADAGGTGGTINLTVQQGSLSIGGVDVSGGSAGGVDGQSTGRGGDGGEIELIASNTSGRADVVLVEGQVTEALLSAAAGEGADPVDPDATANDGLAGRIGVRADTEILVDAAAPGDPTPGAHIAGGDVVLVAQAVGTDANPVVLSGAGSDDDAVAVEITLPPKDTEDTDRFRVATPAIQLGLVGDVVRDPDPGLDLLPDQALGELDRLAIYQPDAAGTTLVTDSSGGTVFAVEGVDAGNDLQRVVGLDSSGVVTGIEYRLVAPSPDDDANAAAADLGIDVAGGGSVGSGGLLLATPGEIRGAARQATDPPHIRTRGDLVFGEAGLEPTLIAAGPKGSASADPLTIEVDGDPLEPGNDPVIAMTVAGSVDLEVVNTDDVSGSDRVGGVAIIQKDVGADVDIELPDADFVAIAGDSDASTSTLAITTSAHQTDFLYELGGDDAVGADPAQGDVIVEAGGASLGGTTVLIAKGDIVLGGGADVGPAIDAGGAPLALLATGALRAVGGAAPDLANVSGLLLAGNEGAGSETRPIRIDGDEVSLAADADTGDVVVEMESATSGDLRVTEFVAGSGAEDDPFNLTVQGVRAGGDVRLANHDGRIVFTGDSSERGTADFATATAGGDLVLDASSVALETFLAPGEEEGERVAVNDTRLVAGGDVVFSGPIEWSESGLTDDDGNPLDVGASLRIDAGGTTTFDGDVGVDGGIVRLATTDVRLARDVQVVARDVAGGELAGGVDFDGTIDGPGALTVRAVGTSSQDSVVVFRGDVGVGNAVGGFDVDADSISFTAADRVVAGVGGIALNADPARNAGPVPTVATITDAVSSVSFETSGAFATGERQKVSVVGDLAITAAGGARFGDLAANTILVDSPQIVLLGRPPGEVRTHEGLIMDQGVDLVANSMQFTSPVLWDGQDTMPTLVLGSGGVVVPGSLEGFRVIRLDAAISAVTPSDFLGVAAVLDLTGTGPPVVGDPSEVIPRLEPQVVPFLHARFDDTPPAALPRVGESELLAFLRCAEAGGQVPCGRAEAEAVAAVATTSPLATPRAQQLVAGYRALIDSPDAHARLFASLSVALAGYRELSGPGPVDGAGLYRFLAASPPYYGAKAQIDELARLLAYVQLMGLPASEVASVQRVLAERFAATAAVDGIDAGVVMQAVQASGIGVPPPGQLRDRV